MFGFFTSCHLEVPWLLKVPPPPKTNSKFGSENSNGLEIVGVEEAKRFTIGSQLLAYLFLGGAKLLLLVSGREGVTPPPVRVWR